MIRSNLMTEELAAIFQQLLILGVITAVDIAVAAAALSLHLVSYLCSLQTWPLFPLNHDSIPTQS